MKEKREVDVVTQLIMGLKKNMNPSLLQIDDVERELVLTGVRVPRRKPTDLSVVIKTPLEKDELREAKKKFRKDMRAMYPDFTKKQQGKLKYLSIHIKTDD